MMKNFNVTSLLAAMITISCGGGGGGSSHAPAPVETDQNGGNFVTDCEVKTIFKDIDGDGYGDDSTALEACLVGNPGFIERGGDIDDNNANIFPEASCGNIAHGQKVTRLAYNFDIASPGTCDDEVQKATCENGRLSDYTGTYLYESCNAKPFGPSVVRVEHDGALATSGITARCAVAGGLDSDSYDAVSYEFEWLRNGVKIASGETYTITDDDVFQELSCSAVSVDTLGAKSDAETSANTVTGVNAICASENMSDDYTWSSAEGRAGTGPLPYAICTHQQWTSFVTQCGDTADENSAINASCADDVELLADIDMNPGNDYPSYRQANFGIGGSAYYTGKINGNGRTVSNFEISYLRSYGSTVAVVMGASYAEITNIHFKGNISRFNESGSAAGLVGSCSESVFENVSFEGVVNTKRSSVGLVYSSSNCEFKKFKINAELNMTGGSTAYWGGGLLIGSLFEYNLIEDGKAQMTANISENAVENLGVFSIEAYDNPFVNRVITTASINSTATNINLTGDILDGTVTAAGYGYLASHITLDGAFTPLAQSFELATQDDFSKMVTDFFDLESTWIFNEGDLLPVLR